MNVVIYARFSSHSQTEQSIEGQLKVCYEYAESNHYTVVGEYIDRAISGTTDNRAEFQRMISDSDKHTFEGVLVYQLDRFARNRYDSAINKAKLKKNGVRVLSAKENIADDASGILVEGVLESMAEYYSVELSQKIHRGMAINAEKCLSNGSNPGLGFKVDGERRFYVDEEEAAIVREIYERYASGETKAEIIRDLKRRRVKTSLGKEFSPNSLSHLLSNKRYIGVYLYKGKETPGGMPRILDDDLFYRVQSMMNKNKNAPARTHGEGEYLLTTKLFCGHCKEMMVGYGGTSKTGRQYHYYMCKNARRKKCGKKIVSKSYIEDRVVNECLKMLTEEKIRFIAKKVAEECAKSPDNLTAKALKKAIREADMAIENLWKAIEQGRAVEMLTERLNKRIAEKAELEAELAIEENKKITLTEAQILAFLDYVCEMPADDVNKRRAIINIFVQSIYLYDDHFTLIINASKKPLSIDNIPLDDIETAFEGETGALEGCSSLSTPAPPNQKSEPLSEWTEVRIFLFSERFGILKGGAAAIFDYERRIQALEARVQALEDALKKERAAQVPDAQAQEKVTAQSSPAPAVQTPEKAPEQSPAQQTVSAQLRAALDAPADPSCFHYVPEPGTVTDFWNNLKPERALQKLVGKGLRITAYTGFDAERVVIPAKIGGQPVVSIGEKAFKNTTVSEVILPGSIKAILGGAFSGCKRLQHIDLPDGLEYLGSHCFASSGLTALHFPDRLKTIPEGCCGGCANLSDVTFGQQVQTIQGSAFHACKKLQTVSFPESLLRVDNDAFEKTAITRFIFPAGVQEVGDVKHSRFYIEPRYPAFDTTISDSPVLVFLGMDAVLKIIDHTHIALIYCLPGSKVQQIARDKGIPVRPLSEFQMEDA